MHFKNLNKLHKSIVSAVDGTRYPVTVDFLESSIVSKEPALLLLDAAGVQPGKVLAARFSPAKSLALADLAHPINGLDYFKHGNSLGIGWAGGWCCG